MMDINYLNGIVASAETDFQKFTEEKNKVFKKNYYFESPYGGKRMLTLERHPKKKEWRIEDGVGTPWIGEDLDRQLLMALYEKR
jgi:hypothetical protein